VVIKAADEFRDKTTAPNQLWQTDFTYLKVIGWGWFYLSTILDDYSRYIIAWKLCTTMKTDDVTDTLKLALKASGCDNAKVIQKPRLLSDNGSSYISGDLAEWLEDQKMDHVRGAPYHPQTQGKIERWHQTLKNRILLENYYLSGDLENQIGQFVDHYNNHRYHESLKNVTPADAYFGRDTAIIEHSKPSLEPSTPSGLTLKTDESDPPLNHSLKGPKCLMTDNRKIAELLRIEGWVVNHKRIERMWREEGLQLPHRHKKRKRLYHKDSSVTRLRPQYPGHVSSIDFVHDKLSNGRSYKMLTVLDEYTREALCHAASSLLDIDNALDFEIVSFMMGRAANR